MPLDTAPLSPAPQVPVVVQVLSIIFYAGFAISVSIVAMAMFGIVGIGLAVLFAWQWTRIPALNAGARLDAAIAEVSPRMPQDAQPSSGNQSFDAYRDALMARLEKEQTQFDGFLTRLRDAKDKHEFDKFMDDRSRAAQRAEA
ncbi:DUF2852 domain-containing protein [Gymnodinialimonas sp.]